ncbi:MAG: AmmeMemoRadiSam system radical SAM enzyme [Desulfotomaculales bacterium]
MKEALFYEKKGGGLVFCRLCPKQCTIRPGHRGFCRVRENREGVLYALNYGKYTAAALDPVEKKPLYHFYPGAAIYSLGTFGCNLHCGFCQNWEIAHGEPSPQEITPEKAVAEAVRYRERGSRNIGIAFTYSEPLMWYEFVYDTARLAKEKGLQNVLVTNGYVGEEPLRALLPFIDAMNIDVKGFTGEYYRRTCAGKLEPVLRTVEISSGRCHVELTTLLVTGLNDSEEEISKLAEWVAGVDRNIPLHFSRYFPNYKMDLPPTPLPVLRRAAETAGRKLNYVYVGNAPELNLEDTFCPHCGQRVIVRRAYDVRITGLKEDNTCARCGGPVSVVR